MHSRVAERLRVRMPRGFLSIVAALLRELLIPLPILHADRSPRLTNALGNTSKVERRLLSLQVRAEIVCEELVGRGPALGLWLSGRSTVVRIVNHSAASRRIVRRMLAPEGLDAGEDTPRFTAAHSDGSMR